MRQITLIVATTVALIACGQPSSAGPGNAAAAAQGAGGAGAAQATQADYVARCTRDMIAQNPQASRWAPDQCDQQWAMVVAAGPMAEAAVAAAPVSGAADPAALRTHLTTIRWDARPEGTLIASGRLGQDVSVQVDRNGPTLNFFWSGTGEPIPYNIVDALRVRGAEVSMIACYSLGGGENTEAYRVLAPGRAAFAMSIYHRDAPTANADAFYNVGVGLSGQVQTIAQLRRDGNEWNPTCP